MSPAIAALIAQALLTYGPEVARELVTILSKTVVTVDDWEKIFVIVESKSYAQYVAPK